MFFLSSRLPSLVLAARISHLLHFRAKISHSYCSSICPLVSGFVSCVFISFSIVFIGLSMMFFNLSMVFFNCSMVSSIFPWFSSIVLWFSSIVPWFSSTFQWFSLKSLNISMCEFCAWFSFSFHLFLLIVPEFSLSFYMTNHDYMYM